MAVNERTQVVGAFRDRALAEQAVAQLRQAGWPAEQIHIFGEHNSGGILSSLKQAFSGHDIPVDASANDLDQIELTDEQRQFFQRELDAGYLVVSVQPGERPLDAQDILQRNGAYNVVVPQRIEEGSRVVPIRSEEMQVNKRVVQVGEVRIHKRVMTEERTFTVPVTREEVTIERLPVGGERVDEARVDEGIARDDGDVLPGRPTTARQAAGRPPEADRYDDEVLHEGGTLRIIVREERVHIDKYPVVVEEIVVRKQPVVETKQLAEPVRHEEVHVERLGNVHLHTDGDNATL